MIEEDTFEGGLVDLIQQLEGEGVDFKQDVGFIELRTETRPDVLITITFVDNDVETSFRETDNLLGRLQ